MCMSLACIGADVSCLGHDLQYVRAASGVDDGGERAMVSFSTGLKLQVVNAACRKSSRQPEFVQHHFSFHQTFKTFVVSLCKESLFLCFSPTFASNFFLFISSIHGLYLVRYTAPPQISPMIYLECVNVLLIHLLRLSIHTVISSWNTNNDITSEYAYA